MIGFGSRVVSARPFFVRCLDCPLDCGPNPARGAGHRLALRLALGPLLALLLASTPAHAADATLSIDRGLSAYQVLQRDAQNTAAVALEGSASAAGRVEARVVRNSGTPASGAAGEGSSIVIDWQPLGDVEGGRWSGRLAGLPTGGPYRVEVRLTAEGAQATAAVDDVLVGDLWLLAGQSNMQGVGDLVDVEPPHPLVHSFDMADQWVLAEEPLHWLLEAVDSVHWRQLTDPDERRRQAEHARQNRTKGTGLGLPFAVEMVRRTGVPVGLVPCAHGGTSMDQWSPELKDRGGESLYGAMIRRAGVVGGRVSGLLWYQGESDANRMAADVFPAKFTALIAAVRSDLGQPDLPFYWVQLGRFVNPADPSGWHQVREAQRTLAAQIPHTAVVPAVDLPLDDLIHISTAGLKRLGLRLANIACREQFGEAVEPGPMLAGVDLEEGGRRIRVRYEGASGRLEPATHIAGFSLRDAQGAIVPLVFEAKVDPQQPHSVLLMLNAAPPEGAQLWYGYGLDPYCNLRDERDMAAPAFGPWELTAAAGQ